jgi:hypothetical protein
MPRHQAEVDHGQIGEQRLERDVGHDEPAQAIASAARYASIVDRAEPPARAG